jgi:hypothetical protein
MSYFLDEKKQFVRFRKSRPVPITHDDIDRWLKSVDGLAKDLKDLKDAKEKAKKKMVEIGKKYKPEQKPVEKEKKEDEKTGEKDTVERTRTKSDKGILPRTTDNKKVDQKKPIQKQNTRDNKKEKKNTE